MKDLSTVSHNSIGEQLVTILCNKTQNSDRLFFRVHVAYYFAKLASMQRTTIMTHDRGTLPINMYAINLATSGSGKGFATNIMEEQVINQFRERFLEDTFPVIASKNLASLAVKRSLRKDEPDEDTERARIDKEFEMAGELAFSFDSGTTAAVKQMRHKLLMANCGSMNMEIDEIGSNLLGNVEVLTTLLELFDVGKIKQKLTKNTVENKRGEEIEGRTPTNLMMFGTPAKVFNGGKIEEEFYSFLETGYARRCLFGFIQGKSIRNSLTANDIYDMQTDTTSAAVLQNLSDDIGQLADSVNFGRALTMSKAVSLLLIEYKQDCEKRADLLGDYDEIRKAELEHRYFKTTKLAGSYAFMDGNYEITEDHVYSAIKLVEESGQAFDKMLTRDRPYVKLAKYIVSVKREVTHVDMVEDLPFYRGSESAKRELLNYATSWGYMNNIIIKKKFIDGIEFLRGETLVETNIKKMRISYSTDWAKDYEDDVAEFNDLHELVKMDNMHWVNHHLLDGHRQEDNAIPGFNLLVIDVDDGVAMDTAKLLLKDFKYLMHTTKSHKVMKGGIMQGDRFRIIMPLSHTLKLDKQDYDDFMTNVYDWLPFDCDTATRQRARKWETFNGQHSYNDGKMVDSLLFIPKTAKCENNRSIIDNQQSLTNIERWFVNHTGAGNRSNNLIRYAYLLVDAGQDIQTVQNNVMALNNKLPDKLDDTEILSTIMVSATKRMTNRP